MTRGGGLGRLFNSCFQGGVTVRFELQVNRVRAPARVLPCSTSRLFSARLVSHDDRARSPGRILRVRPCRAGTRRVMTSPRPKASCANRGWEDTPWGERAAAGVVPTSVHRSVTPHLPLPPSLLLLPLLLNPNAHLSPGQVWVVYSAHPR